MSTSSRSTDGAAIPGDGPSPLAFALAVAVAAVAAFGVALRGEFVWDDRVFLPVGERLLRVSDPRVLFTSGIWAWSNVDGGGSAPVYRPIAAIVLRLMGPLAGADTVAWHALPIALHAVNSVLVLALARRWTPAAPPVAAATGALLFAVLPCHAEAVAWIMAFVHPLGTTFALVGALAMLRHARSGGARWLVAAAAGGALSFLTVEGGAAVPAILLVIAWMEHGAAPPAKVWAACAFGLGLPLLLRAAAGVDPLPLEGGAGPALRSLDFLAAYLRDLVSPWAPPPHGSYPPGGVAGVATWLLAAVVVGAGGRFVTRLDAERRRRAWPAVVWIVVALGPPVLAAMNGTPFYAPRSLYLPSVGLALLAAIGISGFARSPRAASTRVGIAAIAAAIAVGNASAARWQDEETVYRGMMKVDAASTRVRLGLAAALEARGQEGEALGHLRAGLAVARTPGERQLAREALGVHLGSRGQLDEADRLFAAVLSEDPRRSSAWASAGNVALLQRDPARARDRYARALELEPTNGEAAWNLALALDALGDAPGAARARARAAALGVGGGR